MKLRSPHIATVPLILVGLTTLTQGTAAAEPAQMPPNIVIVVADDMGYSDTGYNGNKIIKTPHLDAMAAQGLRFDYFYPGGQMCTPGRFAIMSGRNPIRAGHSGLQATRPQEIFIPRALKQAGYASAQFGKWHLGGNKTSPVMMGFDQATWSHNFYDLDAKFQLNDTSEFVETKGDGSVAIMNLAMEYIRKRAKEPAPFLAYVCFGSPHNRHHGAEEFKALYKDLPEGKGNHAGVDYLAEVSGLDAAVGNLRAELRKLGISENTLVWFTSDNGGHTKFSMDPAGLGKYSVGCRTPGLVEWPARIKAPRQTTVPCGHVDIYPTLLDLAGVTIAKQPVLDGVSLVPLFDGKMTERGKALGFMYVGDVKKADFLKDVQAVWIDGRYKLVVNPDGKRFSADRGAQVSGLFDILANPAQKTNLAEKEPEVAKRMRAALDEWRTSVRASYDGKDFAEP